MPDYTNTGNNIGRRMVSVRFDNVISNPQDDLEERIIDTELPNFVCRCLGAYAAMRTRAKEGWGFWNVVPPVILQWRDKLAAATNKLAEFLTLTEDERKYSISRVESHVTWLPTFKEAFKSVMKVDLVADASVFQAHGFRLSTKVENVCKNCLQIAKGGANKCCSQYHYGLRTQRFVVHNMMMQPIRAEVDG